MNTLEYCHEFELSKINFKERKTRITHPKTIISGPLRSGKTFLIFDYLSNFETKEFLYIDFNDIRNSKDIIKKNLEEYIFRNNIKVLILENFDFSFKISYCDSVIISTYEKKELKGYKNIFLTPLDFEEYLLHENKNQNITQSFNTFLKHGNLPQSVNLPEYKVYYELQNILKLYAYDITTEKILKILFENIDEKKSLNQLFINLKQEIKISKDKFYAMCKKFEDEKIIYFIKKFNQDKATKKIYSYNSAFLNSITHKKKFKNELTNIIFQELLNQKDEIFYLDYIDFYLPNKDIAICSIPFFNSMLMASQLKKVLKTAHEYNIKNIYIITVSNNEFIKKESLQINVLPFYEWALS